MKLEENGELIEFLGRKFDRIDARFDAMDHRFDAADARFDAMEGMFDGVKADFAKVHTRLDSADTRLDSVDTRLDSIDTRVTRIELRQDGQGGDLKLLSEGLTSFREQVAEKFDGLREEIASDRAMLHVVVGEQARRLSAVEGRVEQIETRDR